MTKKELNERRLAAAKKAGENPIKAQGKGWIATEHSNNPTFTTPTPGEYGIYQ